MERVKLGDCIKQIRGVTYGSNDAIDSMQEGYLPILRSNNIGEGSLNFEDLVYIPENLVKDFQILRSGDILITASTGSLKVLGKNGVFINGIKSSFGAFCKVVRARESISPKYLRLFFQSSYYRTTIQNITNGANINNIKNEHIDNLQIPLPNLATQQRIAAILDRADEVRQYNQALIEKYDALTQSLFLEMFGDPVRNEKGWEVKKLKQISSKITSGNTPLGGSNVYISEGITFFRSQNVWKNNLVYEDIAFIDEKTNASMKSSILKHKDILMTKTGRINTENSSLGRAALFLGDDNSANINGHVYLIRLLENNSHEFVVKILTSIEYREHIRKVCVGGIDKRQLNKEHLEEFPIISPPLTLQNQFAERVQIIEQQKEQARQALAKSEELFQRLLQDSFKD